MKSLLENISDLDDIIRQLHKMVSKMRAGQFIDAFRDANSIIARLETNRKEVLAEGIERK